MAEIHDTGPITPREKKMFEQEYRHGAELFQKALVQSAKSDNPYQQEQFGDVMHKAMQVLNQAAKELKRKDLMEQNKQISLDFKTYQGHPTDSTRSQLNQDLDKAKKAIG